uniref:F-box domain-containing protein n=1 Tax=Oryza punctata TaxID=4537 RepID=A0A0E0KNH9_ORYPU
MTPRSNNMAAPRSNTATTTTSMQRRDRLSELPDETLARVLYHLGSVDATRTSALSRRWGNIHATVPVVDLVDPKKGERWGNVSTQKTCFDHQVTAAILGKDLPTRKFRLDAFHPPHDLRDQWFAIVSVSGLEEFNVKLRYWDHSRRNLCPFGTHPKASADFDEEMRYAYTATPPHIFRCDTLRRLLLTNWTLHVPAGSVSMPSLETLFLKRIMAKDGAVQRLISGCPNLVDLTLEQCPSVTGLVVDSPRLDSFAMICCHHASHVVLHAEHLRTLRYKGGLPGENFFSIPNCADILALTIDICESLLGKSAPAVIPITKVITRCTNVTFLHLHLRPKMAFHSGAFTRALRHLPHLRQLALKGLVDDDETVRSVSTLLRNTPNLDVLSLFPLRPRRPKPDYLYMFDGSDDDDSQNGDEENNGRRGVKKDKSALDDEDTYVHVPRILWETRVECLQRLRKIKLLNYKGMPNERMLAKYLLSKASALDQCSVTLPANKTTTEDRRRKLTKELSYWRANKRTRISYKSHV